MKMRHTYSKVLLDIIVFNELQHGSLCKHKYNKLFYPSLPSLHGTFNQLLCFQKNVVYNLNP